ncbi:MAG: conserved membrane protein of unknown function [Promethearchaeota archaeon]|nr:MAG: conserved membrane protein of unknown function [Candidatus Lokiarchaeota archaeon]
MNESNNHYDPKETFLDENDHSSFLREVFLNLLILAFIIISYFYFSETFGSISSYYINNRGFFLNFGFTLLLFTFLSVLAGPFHAFLSGFIGELLYQLSYYNQLSLEWCIFIGVFGLMCGFYNYKPKKYTENTMNVYYTFISLLISSTSTVVLIVLVQFYLISPSESLNNILIDFGYSFFIQTLISVVFIVPLLLWVYDKIFAEESKKIYNMMLTHHPFNASDHTFYLKFGRTRIYFCSRCSGVILGGLMAMFTFRLIELIFGYLLTPELAVLLCILLPIPGLSDWGTQRLLLRESNTRLRLFTGFLIGYALHILNFTGDYYFLMIFIIILYFSVLGFLMYLGSKREMKKIRERQESEESEEPIIDEIEELD